MINVSYNRAYMQRWADHYYSLTENHPPFSFTLQFINDRAECVRRALAEAAPAIAFSVLTGDLVTNVTRVPITGVAPVTVRTIGIAGRPGVLAPTWSSLTNWSAEVAVAAGTNQLVVVAYDYRGTPVASNTVTVVCTLSTAVPDILINELMALNSTTITDEYGEFDDWIELFNDAPSNVSLAGLWLSDRADQPGMFALPATSMPSRSFLLVWADGQTGQGPLHASFKLSGDGEYLGLAADGPVTALTVHSVEFGPQATDVSYGLLPDGVKGSFMFMPPTPRTNNIEPEPAAAAAAVFVLLLAARRR
jgi:hypothetical protein